MKSGHVTWPNFVAEFSPQAMSRLEYNLKYNMLFVMEKSSVHLMDKMG